MVKTIIKANPKFTKKATDDGSAVLQIAEVFANSIQGEGIYTGVPATFIRVQGCSLNCIFCDSEEVWRNGNPYSVLEVIKLFKDNGTIKQLMDGQHLVLTGGSPLTQQHALAELVKTIRTLYHFQPFVEIEDECVINPCAEIIAEASIWNHSPKLKSSGSPLKTRYKPELIKQHSIYPNHWFKFVISDEEDWEEINDMFLCKNLILRQQIILMPEGATRKELQKNYKLCIDLACKHGVRVSDRMHINIWNKKVGV